MTSILCTFNLQSAIGTEGYVELNVREKCYLSHFNSYTYSAILSITYKLVQFYMKLV